MFLKRKRLNTLIYQENNQNHEGGIDLAGISPSLTDQAGITY
ncbi:hypothetical protein [Gracilibacillus phocaeensis]|nr:hypothetical protein [Gracilibacillus phocaeensis]